MDFVKKKMLIYDNDNDIYIEPLFIPLPFPPIIVVVRIDH